MDTLPDRKFSRDVLKHQSTEDVRELYQADARGEDGAFSDGA